MTTEYENTVAINPVELISATEDETMYFCEGHVDLIEFHKAALEDIEANSGITDEAESGLTLEICFHGWYVEERHDDFDFFIKPAGKDTPGARPATMTDWIG